MSRVVRFSGALAAALSTMAATARAQDTAAAVALFDQGLADMQAGRYEKGCPALEESYRLDPLPGVLFTSAECHARWGRWATAVARYEDYLARYAAMTPSKRAKQRNRNDISRRQVAKLKPLVPKLTLVLPASAPAGTRVLRGGTLLGAPSLGAPLPLDPGEHVVTTQVPGGPVHEQRVSIGEGESKTVRLEVVLPRGRLPARESSGPVAKAGDRGAIRSEKGSRTPAYVVGGIGLAGLAVGSVAGILALGEKGTVDVQCRGTRCTRQGKEAADAGKRFGLVSTLGFAVGVAGIATSAVLLLTDGDASPRSGLRPRLRVLVASPADPGALVGLDATW